MGILSKKNEVIKNENKMLKTIIEARGKESNVEIKNFRDFGGDRDVTAEVGHVEPSEITDQAMHTLFSEKGLGHKVATLKPKASWKGVPDFEGSSADVEKLKAINKKFQPVAKEADILANHSEFAIIFIGYNDGLDPSQPVENASEINYFRAIGSRDVEIEAYDKDMKSANFGMPKSYKLTIRTGEDTAEKSVDASRVLHICNDSVGSKIRGLPDLKGCYNYIRDIKKMAGGAGEIYFQNAAGGWAFLYSDEYEAMDEKKAAKAFNKFFYTLKKYLTLTGIKDVKAVSKDYQSASEQIINHLKIMGIILDVPWRIFAGAEAGELASSQDITSFNNTITDRQVNHIIPNFYNKLVESLRSVGIVSETELEISFQWVNQQSDKEIAEAEKVKAEAARALYMTPGLDEEIDITKTLEKMGYKMIDEGLE